MRIAHDVAAGRFVEMAADDEGAGIGNLVDKLHACVTGHLLVHVEARERAREFELDRMMHHVAGEQRAFAAGS